MELGDMKKEDILNPELMGDGIPDLQDELDKLSGKKQKNQDEENQDDNIFGMEY